MHMSSLWPQLHRYLRTHHWKIFQRNTDVALPRTSVWMAVRMDAALHFDELWLRVVHVCSTVGRCQCWVEGDVKCWQWGHGGPEVRGFSLNKHIGCALNFFYKLRPRNSSPLNSHSFWPCSGIAWPCSTINNNNLHSETRHCFIKR